MTWQSLYLIKKPKEEVLAPVVLGFTCMSNYTPKL